MQDHEFEKQVHQRMEEMSIPPSDAVWNGVEKRLHAGNRNKRWIVWFSFLFIALSISGYMMFHSSSDSPGTQISNHQTDGISNLPDHTDIQKQEKSSGEQKEGTTSAREMITSPNKSAGNNPVLNAEPNPSSTSSIARQKTDEQSLQNSLPHANQPLLAKRPKQDRERLETSTPNTQNNNGTVSQVIPVTSTPQTGTLPSRDNVQPGNIINDSMGSRDLFPVLPPGVIRVNRDSSINTSDALNIPRRYAGNFIHKTHAKRKLQWGVNIQGGRTGISRGGLNDLFANTVVADVNYSFSPGNSTANPGPSMIYIPPSALQPGPGFSAEVYVKKQISQRISLSAGLQYSRLTTSHKVGSRIDSSLILRQSNSLEQKDIEEYFKTGSSSVYTNRYHFLSIPVNLQARLTNTRSLPVFWDLGLSASRLIATNALHFDGTARIYYKDIDLFNRTQIYVQTGFPVGLLSRQRFSLKAGPQLEYGITNLIKRERSAGKHLLFVGLKANVDLF